MAEIGFLHTAHHGHRLVAVLAVGKKWVTLLECSPSSLHHNITRVPKTELRYFRPDPTVKPQKVAKRIRAHARRYGDKRKSLKQALRQLTS